MSFIHLLPLLALAVHPRQVAERRCVSHLIPLREMMQYPVADAMRSIVAFGPAADVAGFLAADVVATVLFRGEMDSW